MNKSFLDSLHESVKNLNAKMKEQEEREKLDPPGRVRIDHNAIFWAIKTKEVWIKGEEEPCIELSWGWTAGMTEEEISRCAEDSPKGHSSIIVKKEFATELRDSLTKWLESGMKTIKFIKKTPTVATFHGSHTPSHYEELTMKQEFQPGLRITAKIIEEKESIKWIDEFLPSITHTIPKDSVVVYDNQN